MTLGGIVILLLLLVSLIVFIYVIVKAARGWGVLHTLLLCVLFIECWTFMFVSAGVQYRRVSGTERADKAQKDVDEALERQEDLLWGDFETLNYEAVVPAKGIFHRMTADRGRVWRSVGFVQSGADGYQLDLAALDLGVVDPLAQPDAAAAAPTSSESLENLVVYAFAEELNEQNQPIPVFYLGEYAVSQSQGGFVTLQPTLPLQQSQIDYINSGAAGSWTLYELLPLDSHEAFAAPGSDDTEFLFGRMDEEMLAELFANIPDQDGRRQRVLNSYLKDGQRADEGEDPPNHVWQQVKVLKEYTDQVDSPDVANATERGYFDFEGRSIDVRLKRGEDDGTVQLATDTTMVLVTDKAQQLIDNGTVELVQPVYVRPLIDYQQAFARLVIRSHEVAEKIALEERETAKLERSNQRGQEMINFHQVENQKLTSDTENYSKEVAVLEEAIKQATAQQEQLKKKINDLYRSVQNRRNKLAGP